MYMIRIYRESIEGIRRVVEKQTIVEWKNSLITLLKNTIPIPE